MIKRKAGIKTPAFLMPVYIMDLTNLEGLINNLKTFNTHDEIVKIVDDNRDSLIRLERDQLSKGIDINGNERNDAYAPLTIAYKNKYGEGIGAITDHVTFFMTGELYNSLEAVVPDDTFSFVSPLETYGKMLDRIGDDNFGLSPDNRLQFATEKVLPSFAEVLLEKTTFKM